jgi:hypothetical protein
VTAPLSLKTIVRLSVLLLSLSVIGPAATVIESSTGITLTVNPGGDYSVESADPPFHFGGNIYALASEIAVGSGMDNLGRYQEISFRYTLNGARAASIRTYVGKPVVLFSVKFLETAPNIWPFPSLNNFPSDMFHLTYDGIFAAPQFKMLSEDSPWVFFDARANTFILSPASHLDTGVTLMRKLRGIEISVTWDIDTLPADFQFDSLLVIGKGINNAFDTWGRAMTDLKGKVRPANDADLMLSRLGYWTDNGAAYYYGWESKLGYTGTLQRVKEEFDRQGLPLGYMQLDSWFYPKGRDANWEETTGGIYRYEADPKLFPDKLKGFRDKLGIPLVAHGRWIDADSPYRLQYRMSKDVSTDALYWDAITDYLRGSGVVSYEQDWLGVQAQPNLNLTDRRDYLDNMARAGLQRNMTIQYCMPLPRHYTQSSKYDNVTTIRTSDDRFSRPRWDQFLYGSRLASAMGLWPWSDVFMSYEPDNLLLSTLSAGPVGVGDRIADINADNLLRAVRKDGVIVKPDAPIIPVDDVFLNDAQIDGKPMVAFTHTSFERSRALYVFAYQRGADADASFTPAALGLSGPVYIYDYFKGSGKLMDAAETYRVRLMDRAYYIVVPVGPSGIAFLGDVGHYVSLGKKRITSFDDDGVAKATVAFASGETSRTLFGYSPSMPVASALKGGAGAPQYEEDSHLFRVAVTPDLDGSAVITIR